jgi:hypothetical protein
VARHLCSVRPNVVPSCDHTCRTELLLLAELVEDEWWMRSSRSRKLSFNSYPAELLDFRIARHLGVNRQMDLAVTRVREIYPSVWAPVLGDRRENLLSVEVTSW